MTHTRTHAQHVECQSCKTWKYLASRVRVCVCVSQELPPSPSSSVWSHYLNQLTGATQLTGAGADSAASSGMAALPSLLPDAAQLSVAVMTEMQHLGAMDSHLDQYPQVCVCSHTHTHRHTHSWAHP